MRWPRALEADFPNPLIGRRLMRWPRALVLTCRILSRAWPTRKDPYLCCRKILCCLPRLPMSKPTRTWTRMPLFMRTKHLKDSYTADHRHPYPRARGLPCGATSNPQPYSQKVAPCYNRRLGILLERSEILFLATPKLLCSFLRN